MASTEHRSAQRAEHRCPVCRQPVATELKRHKTLGIFVPVWGAGPCHNPDCATDVAEERQEREKRRAHS